MCMRYNVHCLLVFLFRQQSSDASIHETSSSSPSAETALPTLLLFLLLLFVLPLLKLTFQLLLLLFSVTLQWFEADITCAVFFLTNVLTPVARPFKD